MRFVPDKSSSTLSIASSKVTICLSSTSAVSRPYTTFIRDVPRELGLSVNNEKQVKGKAY